MQPVLPTNLDRASAQVLGFDAAAYITDTRSTLHERLNIPQTFNSYDYLAGNLAKPQEKKKNNFAALISGVLAAGGLTVLTYAGLKGKVKLPEKIQTLLKKIPTERISKAFSDVGEFISGKVKSIKSVLNIDFSKMKGGFLNLFKKVK